MKDRAQDGGDEQEGCNGEKSSTGDRNGRVKGLRGLSVVAREDSTSQMAA
ncbi:MAG: hypothetical protein WBL50_12910 [Candidatus Acidiferrum sp.]